MPGEQDEAILQAEAVAHIARARARVPGFVANHFSVRGAWRLNRHALGRDLWIAPFNFLMALPNFLLRISAVLVGLVGARRLSRALLHAHLGFRTRVQRELEQALMAELLELQDPRDAVRARVLEAARGPLGIYLNTRHVAADVAVGTLAAIAGLLVFHSFTPGSVSAGTALAHVVAREQAARDFLFGDFLGGLYYGMFPPEPDGWTLALSIGTAMLVLAVLSAFSGVLHDPLQQASGLHARRLHKLLNAIERAAQEPHDPGYRPKDPYVGRFYDLLDWIKGLFTF